MALFVVLLVTLLSHYLNGGIRVQGARPRVRPAVKAHISVILGLLALVKAVGYYLARFNLDLSQQRVRPGCRLHRRARPAARPRAPHPGLAGRRRPADLQHPSPGLGAAHPRGRALVPRGPDRRHHLPGRRPGAQGEPGPEHARAALHPAQHRRHPGGHGHQQGDQRCRIRPPSTLTAAQLSANSDTLANVRLWDPTQTQPTYDKLQDIRSYYQFNTLADRPLQGQRRRRPRRWSACARSTTPTSRPRRGSTPPSSTPTATA